MKTYNCSSGLMPEMLHSSIIPINHIKKLKLLAQKLLSRQFFFISIGLCLHISTLNSQTLEFCGVPSFHEANASTPDSIIFDRFGNTYDFHITEDAYGSDVMVRTLAGYFDLRFNLSALEIDIKPAIIDVFEYLSSVIERRINITGCTESIYPDLVKIYITSDPGLDYPELASGSPMYYNVYSVPCDEVIANLVDLKINGGLHSFGFDGMISVNPDEVINWYVGPGSPSSGEVDAFSIILHEALHVLGFASLINSDAEAFDDYFTVWDQFLYTTTAYVPGGPSLNIEELLTSDCSVNCWMLNDNTFEDAEEFIASLEDNCNVSGSLDFVFGDDAIAPLDGVGNTLKALSHLREGCNGQNINYVMQTGLDIQEVRRIISDDELNILCMLGYKVDECDMCYLTVLPEDTRYPTFSSCCETYITACEDQELIIYFDDILCNDFTSDDIEISDYYNPVFSDLTIVATGTSFEITPTEQGLHSFVYTVKGTTCSGCRLLNGFISIYVGPCITECEEIDPCENLICLEDFEDFDPGIGLLAIHTQAMGNFWIATGENTPDICEDNLGNNYLNLASVPANREGLCFRLSEPLGPNCVIQVSFDASSYQDDNIFSWYISTDPPCPYNITHVNFECQPTECGTYTYKPYCIMDIPVKGVEGIPSIYCLEEPQLNTYTFNWQNMYGDVFNYIILFPGPKNNSYPLNYIDNIYVTKICLDAAFTYELTDECLDVEFTSTDQSEENTHEWDFGDEEDSEDINPSHEYSSPDSYIVTHTVTDACGNSETIEHEIMTGDCCADFIVDENTVWINPGDPPFNGIFHTLTVQQGVTLFINTPVVLKFCPGGSIVIENGASVQSKGTFTSLGDIAWKGVFVEGVTSLSQQMDCPNYPSFVDCIPQGQFKGTVGSIIENAEIGIRNYGPSFGTQGGIIEANKTIFKNNGIAVDFAKYENFSLISGQPLSSTGLFVQCDFINTSDYPIDVPFEEFVQMNNVNGMTFIGCTFDSKLEFDSPSSYEVFGKGILANSSGFLVSAATEDPNPPILCPVGECEITDSSSFNGLAHGIFVDQLNATRPYTIVQCKFENCYRGITSVTSSGGTILFNQFIFGQVPHKFSYSGQFDGQIGIQLHFNHDGFEIQENQFDHNHEPEGDTKSIGIECEEIGTAENYIRKNYFDGIDIAHEAFKLNASNSEINSSGLTYLCENMENTPVHGFDLYVADTGPTTIDNIHYLQNDRNSDPPNILPTGNEFGYTGTDIVNVNNTSGFDEYFFYYWHDESNQEPTSPEINFHYSNEEIAVSNECDQTFCIPSCIDPEDLDDAKEDFYELRLLIEDNIADYWLAISEEDFEGAAEKNLIALSNNHLAFRTAYNIVSYIWRDTVNFDVDTLITWYGNLNTFGADLMIAGELAHEDRMDDALDFLDAIPNNRDLFPEQEVDLHNVSTIYRILDVTEIEDLSLEQRDTIRTIAQSDIGSSSGIARAVLSFFGENHPLPYFLPDLNDPPIRYRNPADEGRKSLKASNIQVVPIPASDVVTISWLPPNANSNSFNLTVVNLLGHKIFYRDVEEGELEIQVDLTGWPRGVYIAIILSKEGVLDSKIFVVN